MTPQAKSGSALLTALLIVAVVAVIATTLTLQWRYWARQTTLATTAEKGFRYAEGVQAWAMAVLREDANTHMPELFPRTLPELSFDNTNIHGTIEDAGGLFNLNALINPANQMPFLRLLHSVAPELSPTQGAALVRAIYDWMTPSNADSIYLHADPPYRASHRPFVDVSELRLVNGVSDKLYRALAPVVTALPTPDNHLNINGISAPLLTLFAPMITPQQAQAAINCRNDHRGFSTVNDFLNACLLPLGIKPDNLTAFTVGSDYFLVTGYVTMGDQEAVITSLLARKRMQNAQGQSVVTIIPLWTRRG